MTLGHGETDPSQCQGGERMGATSSAAARVIFDRRELSRIFGLYGRMVAEGERPQTRLLADFSAGHAKDKIWIRHVDPVCMMGVCYAAWPGAI